jgi:hypothetical protein
MQAGDRSLRSAGVFRVVQRLRLAPMSSRSTRTTLAALAALAIGALGAGSALGVTVYSNDFSNKAEYDQISRSGGGKVCDRSYREKQKVMRTAVKRGPVTCSFRPPVLGDAELPDHDLGVDTKVLKKTPKSVRSGAYIELSVRTGGGGVGYTLRVFPQRKRFELTRGPSGGGDFPVRAKSDAIKGINERNRINLVADGARIRAFVNREEVASVNDTDPGQVSGRKLRFGLGGAKDSSKDVVAVIRRVSVAVPTR